MVIMMLCWELGARSGFFIVIITLAVLAAPTVGAVSEA